MITEATMPHTDMIKAEANGYLCAVCQGRVSVAWGGGFGVSGYILRCQDINHAGVTRHNVSEENKKREYYSMDSTALQNMDEKTMVSRVEMARFPQALTQADKRLLAQVAITYGFDPLMGEISIYQGRPFVSIDGRYRKAQETGKLNGVSSRPSTEQERKAWKIPEADYFFRAEVMVSGAEYPFVGWGRVYQSEIGGKGFLPIEKNPQRMAEKRAEAQALRKAFHIPLPSIEDIGSPEADEEPAVRVVNVTTGEVAEVSQPSLPPEAIKAPVVVSGDSQEGKGRDTKVDQRMLYSLIKDKLPQLKTDKSIESWLENVAKIDMARIESEPGAVFQEISEKQGWN